MKGLLTIEYSSIEIRRFYPEDTGGKWYSGMSFGDANKWPKHDEVGIAILLKLLSKEYQRGINPVYGYKFRPR